MEEEVFNEEDTVFNEEETVSINEETIPEIKHPLEGMALVCTASMHGVAILYEFKPIEEAMKIVKKTMGED